MKKLFAPTFLIAGFCVFAATFCLAAPKNGSKSTANEPIIIGAETWPGYLPFHLAAEKGYFKEAGLNVQIKQYPGLGQLSKDYAAGQMPARANLTLDAVKENAEGLDHKVVLAIDYSSGADAIIARAGIQSVEDFKGKKVAYEPDTLEEFFLAWALTEHGLKLSDIVPVFGNPEETAEMLKMGQADVAVSHEPFISKIVASGEFQVIFSSADAPGLITDVLTFRTDFIEAHPETVRAVLDAYFKALDFWKKNPAEAYKVTAKYYQDTPENLEQQFKGITMLDEKDNQAAFTFSAGLQSLYGNMRHIGKFIQKHTGHGPKLDTDRLIEKRFVKSLMKNL